MKIKSTIGLLAALALAAGCSAGPETIVVTGTVEADLKNVQIPSIAVPLVSLDAGFTDLSGSYNPVTGRTATKNGTVATDYGLGSTVQVTKMLVEEGDQVIAGQPLAQLDRRPLRAELQTAKANVQASNAQIGLIGDAIDTTFDRQADVKDARTTVRKAINKLTATRAKLRRTRTKLRKALPKVQSGLAALNQGIQQLEEAIAAIPPGVPVPAELTNQLQALKQKKRELLAVRRKLTTGLGKINAALPKIATGLSKARDALVKLNDAEATILDARNTLEGLQGLAELQTEAMRYSPELVRAQLALTELRAPVSGLVVSAAHAGDNLAPGATAISLRESGPSSVTGWLSMDQLTQVCQGDQASLRTDWNGTISQARISRISTEVQYPPSYVATDEVHLMRAAEVTFDTDTELPAGVPVELTISGCGSAVATTSTDR